MNNCIDLTKENTYFILNIFIAAMAINIESDVLERGQHPLKKLLKKCLSPKTIKNLRLLKFMLLGRDFPIKAEISLPYENFGTSDICSVYMEGMPPEPLVYSAGLGDAITFELEFILKTGARVFGFDPTPRSLKWLSTQSLPAAFTVLPYAVTPSDGEFEFYLPDNEEYISGSLINMVDDKRAINTAAPTKVVGKRVSTIMKELGHDHIDLLKMDIEGAEFEVLEDILTSKARVSQICVDIHNRSMPGGKKKLKRLLNILSVSGYRIFSVRDDNMAIFLVKM